MTPCLSGRWCLTVLTPFLHHFEPFPRLTSRAASVLAGKSVENICPSAPGAKDWQPTAWSPHTKLLYVPHQHLCMNFKASQVGYIAGTPYVGADVDMYAGPGGYRGDSL